MSRLLQISGDEYWQRWKALQASVASAGLDLFIVSALDSIYYLTGAGFEPLERPFFLLVSASREPVLLVPKLEHAHMRKTRNVRDADIQTYWEHPAPPGHGWPERLRELLDGAEEVGVEPTLSQEIAGELRGYPIHALGLVEKLRLIKSAAEIEMIRRAARYADLGVDRLLAASYNGASVSEGFAETRTVTSRIIREVDDWDPLMSKVTMATWAAPRSAQPHSVPGLGDRLRQGPHIALVLTRINGYAAECERTYFTHPPSTEVRRAFASMREARRIACSKVRPGVACRELDSAINEFLRQEGYDGEDVRLHRTGHGIGLGNHEAPWIADGSADILAENMVISIEPGIYLEGVGGFRHSDTVLVTKDGCEPLTGFPDDIESLTIAQWKPRARFRGWCVRRTLRVARKHDVGV